MKLTPISEFEPKIRDAYNRIKALGLLETARTTVRAEKDSDDAFLAVYSLLPETDRGLLEYYGEEDCNLLVSLLKDSREIESGTEV